MNISIKYQLHDSKKSLIAFYLTIFLTIFLLIILSYLPDSSGIGVRGSIRGIEVASAIFLFIVGLNSFKEVFRLFLQNGISRKSLFAGRLVTVSTVSLGMALIDNMVSRIYHWILPKNGTLEYTSLIEMTYGSRYQSDASGFIIFLEGVLLMFCLYNALSMMGYFITTLYYHLSKGAKIAVSIGVPVGLLTVVPLVDSLVFNNAISRALLKFIIFAFGYANGANPYYAMVTLLLTFAVFSGLSWLLVKKAVMKD